jgi:hypothetical protein
MSGHGQPRTSLVNGTLSDTQHHQAAGIIRLTSEGSLVRSQLRPPMDHGGKHGAHEQEAEQLREDEQKPEHGR